MRAGLEAAREELKRVDHQIYVSLKYTRTVDVLLNIMHRMIEGYDFLLEALLKYAQDVKLITDLPQSPKERVALVNRLFPEPEVQENLELYLLLRKLIGATYKKEQEFRRHVAMIAHLQGGEVRVNIDIITNYYVIIRGFLTYVENKIRTHLEGPDWQGTL
jgi:hypothetical protein